MTKMNDETRIICSELRSAVLDAGINPADIHIHFDDDGVLHQWNDIRVEVPESYADMSRQEQAAYMHHAIYSVLLSPGYYRNLPVQQNMVDFAHALHEYGFDVRVLSCSINADTSRQKMESIGECMPWLPPDKITLLPDGKGKQKMAFISPACINGVNFLIDDHTPNCLAFEEQGGMALKCINGVNGKNGTWRGERVYADNTAASVKVFAYRLEQMIRTAELLCIRQGNKSENLKEER